MALPVRLRQQMRDAHERPRPNPKLRASNSRSALLINFVRVTCKSSTASTPFAWPAPAAVFNPMRSVTFFTRHSGCRLLLRGDERRYEITGVSRAGQSAGKFRGGSFFAHRVEDATHDLFAESSMPVRSPACWDDRVCKNGRAGKPRFAFTVPRPSESSLIPMTVYRPVPLKPGQRRPDRNNSS
jgi:hypothetical protein